jgi:hypothetical protein
VNLAEATGLTAEEFPILQKAIGKLRDSLLKSTRDPA